MFLYADWGMGELHQFVNAGKPKASSAHLKGLIIFAVVDRTVYLSAEASEPPLPRANIPCALSTEASAI